MSKFASILFVTGWVCLAQAAEPFRAVLTDVQKGVYVESLRITNSDVTQECLPPWSVHKYVLHGGKQEGVEVIDVYNGKLRFQVVPTRGMSVQEVVMGDFRLGWDSPNKSTACDFGPIRTSEPR